MPQVTVVPKPSNLTLEKGNFVLSNQTSLLVTEGAEAEAKLLKGYIKPFTLSGATKTNVIELSLKGSKRKLGTEGYDLDINPERINICANTRAGLFYACQTLRQLLPNDISGPANQSNVELPCLTITDVPRFAWRGMMLDVSRHFMPIEGIKKVLDLLAFHKLNVFHWHLTDDQGWRIEIKKYPKLTSKAAWRKSTLIGHASDRPCRYHDEQYGGSYTQEEIRELVAYAAERHITVVPEIDMPGHMQAAIAAYPELGNLNAKLEPRCHWGISQHILNMNEQTIAFMKDVLAEVIDLFPSDFIHVGGDEALKHEWSESRAAQDRMLELGLKNEAELQSWFIKQMADFVSGKGRRLIGWDELLEGGLADGASIMSWRGTKGGIKAAEAGHDVVMSPQSHVYFDYYQAKDQDEPLAIGGHLPLKQVYAFDPIPNGLNKNKIKHILGGQANLWTEYIPTLEHAEYMLFPRLCALAESVWTAPENKNYPDFLKRLKEHFKKLELLGVNYRPLD